MPKNFKEILDNLEAKKVSVVIDYTNPGGFKDNIVGEVIFYNDDFIVIKPSEFKGVKANIFNWKYIISLRIYEDDQT